MPTGKDTTARILLPMIVGAACMIVALTAVNAITDMAQKPQRIGDIIAFSASTDQPNGDLARLVVHRPGQFGCALDLGTLHQSGGSLVVEGQSMEAAGSFRVHWAGERTSSGANNCGDHADLILDGRELDVIALSAGGYGAGQKRLPIFMNEAGI